MLSRRKKSARDWLEYYLPNFEVISVKSIRALMILVESFAAQRLRSNKYFQFTAFLSAAIVLPDY